MPAAQWNGTVVDSPESEPYAVVGDLVLAVRTPRSRDFVTVEVARTDHVGPPLRRQSGVVLSSRPTPFLADQWHGEVHLGDPVSFSVDGASYRLTLARLSEIAAGQPWVSCEFLVERAD
jgi:hypothetical protein